MQVSDEKALYLSDVLPTSYHSVVDTGVKKGDTVAVWVRSSSLFVVVCTI
jgi:threonine dehydrogenase-like Zn-dependent dehydrogenase